MQYHPVIGGICVMTMPKPVGTSQMDLHIASPEDAFHQYLGIEKVRPSVMIVHARVYDLHPPAIGGAQATQRQNAMLPYVMQ